MGPLARTLGSRTADDRAERTALDPPAWIGFLAGLGQPGNESERLGTTMSRQPAREGTGLFLDHP